MRLTKQGAIHNVGEIVALECVDWAVYGQQHDRRGPFGITKAMIYGEVIGFTEDGEGIVVSPQVFADGDARCTLVVPWCTIRRFFIIAERDDFTRVGAFEIEE